MVFVRAALEFKHYAYKLVACTSSQFLKPGSYEYVESSGNRFSTIKSRLELALAKPQGCQVKPCF